MARARGTKQVEGFVNFPVNSPEFDNAGGGGMLVKLVVIEPDDYEQLVGRCCGVSVIDMLIETFVADDLRPRPQELDFGKDLTSQDIQADEKAWVDYVAFHFPMHAEDSVEGHERYLSRPYRASIVMGSTGWSCSDKDGTPWHATFESLTGDGKALYLLMQKLNPGCSLHLLTFLDT